MDKNKLILPIGILLGCAILGHYLYIGLERQQAIKTAQDKQEYIGKRKAECYAILENEKKQETAGHYSVVGVKYYEPSDNPYDRANFSDTCRVEYKYLISNADGTTRIETEYKNY